jgi:hypothetical protein
VQVPIPNDWDGTSFCCHIVEWPDSPEWRQILAGLLLSPTAGRFWDGATGTITDAQETGREIETRNCIFDEDS